MQDEGEDCDTTMNVLPKDAMPGDCTAECKIAGCGNGALEGSEECDDGNKEDSDKCTTECTVTKCGDNIIQSPNGAGMPEACDDGNISDNDACLTTCLKAECGDGFLLDGSAEECDDGNDVDDDDCNNMCIAAPRYIFVSSTTMANGNLEGIGAANDECASLAKADMSLVQDKKWRAWLSDAMTSPAEAPGIKNFKGVYRSPKGETIAKGIAGLVKGSIERPININEKGEVVTGYVWTGTRANGEIAMGQDLSFHCNSWLDGVFSSFGLVGNSSSEDQSWTEAVEQAMTLYISCNSPGYRIYCVEVP